MAGGEEIQSLVDVGEGWKGGRVNVRQATIIQHCWQNKSAQGFIRNVQSLVKRLRDSGTSNLLTIWVF